MIRYKISPSALTDWIESEKSGWLIRAAERTEQFRQEKEYAENGAIWSEIKRVYMTLQGDKCAYCERLLSDGPIEHDLEHYRPKRSVQPWPPAGSPYQYPFPTGIAHIEGYYLLAYNRFNYATACKRCNSNFKSNFFPVAATRIFCQDEAGPCRYEPQDYAEEKPFLPYPIGEIDDDPETLLTFTGIIPVPHPDATETQKRRAQVTIDFFGLAEREDLRRERCFKLVEIDMCYRALRSGGPEDKAAAQMDLASHLAPEAAHTNCAKSFDRLCQDQPQAAENLAREAREFLVALRKKRLALTN